MYRTEEAVTEKDLRDMVYQQLNMSIQWQETTIPAHGNIKGNNQQRIWRLTYFCLHWDYTEILCLVLLSTLKKKKRY